MSTWTACSILMRLSPARAIRCRLHAMGQAPALQSFPVMSGDQLSLPITVVDNDDAVVNLSGGAAVFKMARRPQSDAVIDSTASPATATAVLTTPASGLITVTITDENTEALNGDYYYECRFTDISDREAVVARGWITFEPNLT